MSKDAFDIKIIENKEIITIFKSLVGLGGIFNVTINSVPFIPDTMIVKNISYKQASDLDNTFVSIYSDIINKSIGCFNPVTPIFSQSNINLEYIIQKPIKGSYNFTILDSAGQISTNSGGIIFIQLEFVKYKSIKQDKIY